MNLSTAAIKGAREVGIRKAIRVAPRSADLAFLSESMMVVMLAFTVSDLISMAGHSIF